MEYTAELKRRNLIKYIGSGGVIVGALSGDSAETLISNGPGVFTGICIALAVASIVFLNLHGRKN